MLNKHQTDTVLAAVLKGSAQWKTAFNCGDAKACAAQYESDAVMHAKPFGTFTGTTAIESFWQQIISDGFAEVEYLNPRIQVIDEQSAILQSDWQMNHAQGVIHKELWVIQADGSAKLREDDFEVQGEREEVS